MKNRLSNLQIPLTSAALCLVLAACGGGSSGSDKSVSSSPNSPSANAPAAGQGNTATQPGTGSGGTGSGGTGSGGTSGGADNPGTQPSKPAVPQTTEELLSDQGIRGNVLRSMLDQKLNARGVRGDAATARAADGRYGWFLPQANGTPSIWNSVRLDPTNYVDESRPGIPYQISRYHPLEGNSTYTLSSQIYDMGNTNRDTTVPIRPFTLKVPISASAQLLSLDKTMSIQLGSPHATSNATPDTPAEEITLTATEALEVPSNALLPFGKAVQTWRGDNQQKVELVMAGRCDMVNTDYAGKVLEEPHRAPGAELCWNFDLTHLKRQICVMYTVPASDGNEGYVLSQVPSTAEAQARLEEMVDQRSLFAGESGALFWRNGSSRCENKS